MGSRPVTLRRISQRSRFEEEIGYSRAVVDGGWIFVSGTTGFDYATMTIPVGAADQAEQALANIEWALGEAGATLADVLRVTYYVTSRDDWAACIPLLKRAFGEIGPAATMVIVALADPRMRIAIQVTARAPGVESTAAPPS